MSEHITHVAVYEDINRIIQHSPKVGKVFKTCLSDAYDSGIICSGARGNHLFAIPILRDCRKKWQQGDHSLETKQQIAGALGWLTHRATDLYAKPLYRAVDAEGDPKYSGNDYRIYHDMIVYKEVYKSGQLSTLSDAEYFSPALLEADMTSEQGSRELKVDKIEPWFTVYWQASFVKLHQFTNDFENTTAWFKKLFKNTQDYTEVWPDYIEAFQAPDPNKMEKYITNPNFYDNKDNIIRYVRAIQTGKTPDVDLQESLEQAKTGSDYAKMLLKSFLFLEAANHYFEGKLTDSEVYDAVEIMNKNHRR